jgi:hypothetical protein
MLLPNIISFPTVLTESIKEFYHSFVFVFFFFNFGLTLYLSLRRRGDVYWRMPISDDLVGLGRGGVVYDYFFAQGRLAPYGDSLRWRLGDEFLPTSSTGQRYMGISFGGGSKPCVRACVWKTRLAGGRTKQAAHVTTKAHDETTADKRRELVGMMGCWA